ncbi:MAG: nucleotide exchange factor GrpE [Thermoplasmata archaeon]
MTDENTELKLENKMDDKGNSVNTELKEKQEEELKKLLEMKEEEIKTLKSQMLYLQADFENFRKRKEKENSELRKLVLIDFMRALLSLLDDFEAMEKNLGGMDAKVLSEGLLALKKNFLDTLWKMGLREIECEKFDPNMHEIEAVVAADADNKVLEIVRKGYILEGVVLRPARIIVGKKFESQKSEPNTTS